MVKTDKRCCGSGVCIINADGECWCGQVWDGEKMAHPSLITKSPSPLKPKQTPKDLGPES
ncbi:hypothetical protein ICN41_09655 [Polynucleobacter sp. 15G-AUS-farblos]|uniref:hypothetical protein n=1 Tax=Polynucleobacter sp. 15G-AUS-farblos TaxID=2689094 RepID=UPI001C0E1443|nr:hypothetical protein [Polynucleobacter sp. 15G-AUS-farblos]MBU3584252.1 hypothetical protein [Polynucleobacter sp. 15G-AUS-farblos]